MKETQGKRGPKKGAKYKQYTEEDKAIALAALKANGGNIARAARELGVPWATLNKWHNGKHLNVSVLQRFDESQATLSDLYEHVSRVYIGHALEEKIVRDASAREAIIVATASTDKMRLLRNQPTNINASAEPNDDELLERLRNIAKRVAERSQQADPRIAGGTQLDSEQMGVQQHKE